MATPVQSMATYLDVWKLIPQLYEEEDNKWVVKQPAEIRSIIMQQDAQLRSQLKNYYGVNLTCTPYVIQPIPKLGNQGNGQLLLTHANGVLAIAEGSTVYTQVYELEFTSEVGAFKILSDLSGSQGTGDTASDFTTTDTFLTIDKDLWEGNFKKGDIFFIKVYNHEIQLINLSALLASVTVLNFVFTAEIPDASPTAENYKREYDRQIKALQQGLIFLEKSMIERDISPTQVDYEIDQFGQDVTNYADDDWSRRNIN